MKLTTATTHSLIDRSIQEILAEADIRSAPIDALQLAGRLGIEVVLNRSQKERGRLVESGGRTMIVVRPEPRSERYQWTIAHEIGEYVIPRLSTDWTHDLVAIDSTVREWMANRFATCLLTPLPFFLADATEVQFDLFKLKEIYHTASYEVIALRMLDAETPCLISIFDNGRMTRRLTNLEHRPPKLLDIERQCQREASQSRLMVVRESDVAKVQAWPIHEEEWKREIIRTEPIFWE